MKFSSWNKHGKAIHQKMVLWPQQDLTRTQHFDPCYYFSDSTNIRLKRKITLRFLIKEAQWQHWGIYAQVDAGDKTAAIK